MLLLFSAAAAIYSRCSSCILQDLYSGWHALCPSPDSVACFRVDRLFCDLIARVLDFSARVHLFCSCTWILG